MLLKTFHLCLARMRIKHMKIFNLSNMNREADDNISPGMKIYISSTAFPELHYVYILESMAPAGNNPNELLIKME